MIQSDRDVFLAAHVTQDIKDRFKIECDRRKKSMSAQVAEIIEDWVTFAEMEQLEPIRSNKRDNPHYFPGATLIDVPTTGKITILPGIPGHQHTLDNNGRPTCGCKFEEDVPLPLEK